MNPDGTLTRGQSLFRDRARDGKTGRLATTAEEFAKTFPAR